MGSRYSSLNATLGLSAAALRAGIQAANTFVEDRVREHPVDWFWVHKRWPDKVYAALDRQP